MLRRLAAALALVLLGGSAWAGGITVGAGAGDCSPYAVKSVNYGAVPGCFTASPTATSTPTPTATMTPTPYPSPTAQPSPTNVNPFAANVTIGDGGNLIFSGANASGEGLIQFQGTASAGYDTNLMYLSSTAQTGGYMFGSTPAFSASNGPYFGGRGNTYSAVGTQRGLLFFSSGNPSAPAAAEGTIRFLTGADVTRVVIGNSGTTGIGASITNAGTLAGATLTVDASGPHGLFVSGLGSAPTITAGCGTSPSVASTSTNVHGDINVGTGGVATTCTITFATARTNAPHCIAQNVTAGTGQVVVTTTTTMQVTNPGGAYTASDHVVYHCLGY